MALEVWPGMNDLPELVAIPNLILAALRNPYGFTEADLRFARLHAADQIEGARRAILAYYEALAAGRDARVARDVAFLEIEKVFGLSPNVANKPVPPREHISSEYCWCQPTMYAFDPPQTANAGIERVEARKTYERSMCPHEHAVNDWRLHPLTPNASNQPAP